MRRSPKRASGSKVLGGGEEIGGGADEGSSVQVFGPEREDVARGCGGWTGGLHGGWHWHGVRKSKGEAMGGGGGRR
jgi:hypothetical protein